jgi:hypothetical protein
MALGGTSALVDEGLECMRASSLREKTLPVNRSICVRRPFHGEQIVTVNIETHGRLDERYDVSNTASSST